jgi:RNA polymerase sigma factor (sigma-70 family)
VHPDETRVEHLLRTEAPQVLGALVRRFGHFEVAEDAVQETLLAAVQRWPTEGVPEHPRGWLIRVGYRRMVDLLRSDQARRNREMTTAVSEEPMQTAEPAEKADDSLTLLFLCCHPALSSASQVALTLRAVGGLTTVEIAHAYGVAESAMAQRISRAKQQIRNAGGRFRPPPMEAYDERLSAVCQVLYLIFNEGYTASHGDRLDRIDLSTEAIRLTRMLHRLAPDRPEVAGLLALMLLTQARRAARIGDEGDLVTMADQDRARWDPALTLEGTELITTALRQRRTGPYQLQAAIAAVHNQAARYTDTDWAKIAALYAWLERLSPTPMVRLGRAVAVGMAHGPVRGFALLDELPDDPLTRQRERAVRAHLTERAGEVVAAARLFEEAAQLTANEPEQRYLRGRAAALRNACEETTSGR